MERMPLTTEVHKMAFSLVPWSPRCIFDACSINELSDRANERRLLIPDFASRSELSNMTSEKILHAAFLLERKLYDWRLIKAAVCVYMKLSGHTFF